jgi:hypothetical protein
MAGGLENITSVDDAIGLISAIPSRLLAGLVLTWIFSFVL